MLNMNPTAFGGSLLCCSVVTHLQDDPATSLCVCGEKKNPGKGLGAASEMQCPVQLLLKAAEGLQPLGDCESWAGRRRLQSDLVDFLFPNLCY